MLSGRERRPAVFGSSRLRSISAVNDLPVPCSPVRASIGYGPFPRRLASNHETTRTKAIVLDVKVLAQAADLCDFAAGHRYWNLEHALGAPEADWGTIDNAPTVAGYLDDTPARITQVQIDVVAAVRDAEVDLVLGTIVVRPRLDDTHGHRHRFAIRRAGRPLVELTLSQCLKPEFLRDQVSRCPSTGISANALPSGVWKSFNICTRGNLYQNIGLCRLLRRLARLRLRRWLSLTLQPMFVSGCAVLGFSSGAIGDDGLNRVLAFLGHETGFHAGPPNRISRIRALHHASLNHIVNERHCMPD